MRIGILIALLLAGCSGTKLIIPTSEHLVSEISTSRAAWEYHAFQDYRYVFQAGGGMCSAPKLLITVRSAQVSSMRYAENGRNCYSGENYSQGQNALPTYASQSRTVDDLFAELEECREGCVVISEEFHPVYGFPVSFRIEPLLEDGTMLEDASYFGRVFEFELL